MTKLREITQVLESWAPLAWQESYDNSGLIYGDPEMDIHAALITLDVTEAVLDEAIREGCNLIIAHHPIIFSGQKKFTGKSYVQRILVRAIKADIALYAIHTNLDSVDTGVNRKLMNKIGVTEDVRILVPKVRALRNLICYVPSANNPETELSYIEEVRQALWKAGAGNIGKYHDCAYSWQGEGTFRPDADAQPMIGEAGGKRETTDEYRLEVIYPQHLEGDIMRALRNAHPYEEIAYSILVLENGYQEAGTGMIGRLKTPMDALDFLRQAKSALGCEVIKYTNIHKTQIETIAVCGGSGSEFLKDALAQGADIYLTSDYKYHQFFDAENRIIIADVGHYESEHLTIELIYEYLQEKFRNFALLKSRDCVNPVQYLK